MSEQAKLDIALATRLEHFANYCARYGSVERGIRQSEIADIRLAAERLKALTSPPDDLPEASRASHMS